MQANAKEKRKKTSRSRKNTQCGNRLYLSAGGFDSFRIWGKPGGTQTLARWRGQVETMIARFAVAVNE